MGTHWEHIGNNKIPIVLLPSALYSFFFMQQGFPIRSNYPKLPPKKTLHSFMIQVAAGTSFSERKGKFSKLY
jgi:hypothetical protein